MTWGLPFIPAGGSAGITICDATKKTGAQNDHLVC